MQKKTKESDPTKTLASLKDLALQQARINMRISAQIGEIDFLVEDIFKLPATVRIEAMDLMRKNQAELREKLHAGREAYAKIKTEIASVEALLASEKEKPSIVHMV